jgi:hypothetical protein
MNELEQKIKEIIDRARIWPRELVTIKEFISKCSLSDFEQLKDMEYDVTTQDT